MIRPLLLERLYPYLSRSPTATRAIARQFFGKDLCNQAMPGFAHQPRWQAASALQRLFSGRVLEEARSVDVVARLLASLPAAFSAWEPLAQDQYLEVRTLLSGYLLSSQGDRMLMAHSVEGRFPFLDAEVVQLADSLPAAFKLRVLDEKHVLKEVAGGIVPDEVVRRSKQPYRAPDAASFVGPGAPEWVGEVLSERAVEAAGAFDPRSVSRLWKKCQAVSSGGQFSNADNMAVVGVLSTGILHERLIRPSPSRDARVDFKTMVNRVSTSEGLAALTTGHRDRGVV